MSISRSFEEAFQKALRMANENILDFEPIETLKVLDELINPNNDRINKIAVFIVTIMLRNVL